MLKYSFYNDYSEGAHPSLLQLMAQSNTVQEDGYGNDSLSQQAVALIQQQVQNPQSAVHFIPGGTQANLIALAAILRPHESVIAASSGHIHVHEAGAVESTGHKINIIPSTNGKLAPEQIQEMVDQHTDEHMVKPRVVFISNSTEVGTVYTKSELTALAEVCHANHLYLYMDGARLGSALTSRVSDLSLADLGRLVDIFYIGGTKNGALLGEAMVINTPEIQQDFRFHLKQRGALLAKGRILGIQFLGLFTDGLYFELARHANAMAEKISCELKAMGFNFLTDSPSNQIFPILPNTLIDTLHESYGFYVWSKVDASSSAIRLVTSWAAPEDRVDEFIRDVKKAWGR
jgi:threonine aldolase